MAGLTALIPLDGTKLSESAFELLPFAKTLGVTKVRLVSSWVSPWTGEQLAGRPKGEADEINSKGQAYLNSYLAGHAATVGGQGFEVAPIVKAGKAAEAVLEAAGKDTDLVLIATHGRTGVARFRMGSVADTIIRDALCPVLVIGPNVSVSLSPYAPKRILAPIDGTELSEEALKLATRVADSTGAELD